MTHKLVHDRQGLVGALCGCSSCDETFDSAMASTQILKTLGAIPGSLPGTCDRLLAHCE